jgi:hypothetical protein
MCGLLPIAAKAGVRPLALVSPGAALLTGGLMKKKKPASPASTFYGEAGGGA